MSYTHKRNAKKPAKGKGVTINRPYTPKGCICPPEANLTCQRSDCGRKDQPSMLEPQRVAAALVGRAADKAFEVLLDGAIPGTRVTTFNDAEENVHVTFQRDYGDETSHD